MTFFFTCKIKSFYENFHKMKIEVSNENYQKKNENFEMENYNDCSHSHFK